MNLSILFDQSIGGIVKTLGHYYIANRDGRAFLSQMLPRIQKSAAIRNRYEASGTHIPPFLIASVVFVKRKIGQAL